MSTIKGTSEQIKKNLIGEGDNVVDITLNEGSNIYQMEYQGIPQGVPVITEEQKQQILDLDHVENASLYRLRQYADSIYYQNQSMDGGKDETASNNFFEKGREIGKTIEIKGEPFTVVGIIKKSDEYEPVINSIEDYYTYYSNDSGMILMPDTAWPIVYQYD